MKITIGMMLMVALLNSACSDPTPPPTPTPVQPTITDTFTGTLQLASDNVHIFSVQQVGNVQVTLTNIDPGASVQLSIGTPSSSTGQCSAISSVTVVPGTTPQ